MGERIQHLQGQGTTSVSAPTRGVGAVGKGTRRRRAGVSLVDRARGAPRCPSHGRMVLASARTGRGKRVRSHEGGGRQGDRDVSAASRCFSGGQNAGHAALPVSRGNERCWPRRGQGAVSASAPTRGVGAGGKGTCRRRAGVSLEYRSRCASHCPSHG